MPVLSWVTRRWAIPRPEARGRHRRPAVRQDRPPARPLPGPHPPPVRRRRVRPRPVRRRPVRPRRTTARRRHRLPRRPRTSHPHGRRGARRTLRRQGTRLRRLQPPTRPARRGPRAAPRPTWLAAVGHPDRPPLPPSACSAHRRESRRTSPSRSATAVTGRRRIDGSRPPASTAPRDLTEGEVVAPDQCEAGGSGRRVGLYAGFCSPVPSREPGRRPSI
ncbi:hypothetical protein UK15_00170 [Streptomyces variegatus]|uniref:Uncharacterized protein n=1 Tax=Streptomyces variegatus TaxID=284040 RepID=A0A0M2GZV6_9ACTN|nr:hypothetical protein UK15_00170 [Streptomyces variegatus]